MIKILFLTLALVFSFGCIKPHDDASSLGPEVASTEVIDALVTAQKGLAFEDAFRVGDKGTLQIINKVFSASQVDKTHEWQVDSITAEKINCTGYIDETQQSYPFSIDRNRTLTSMVVRRIPVIAKVLEFLPHDMAKKVALAYESSQRFLSSIVIENQSAIGDVIRKQPNSTYLAPLFLQSTSRPESGTVNIEETKARYFGLKVLVHKLETANCVQILDCKINATQIQVDEISKDKDGNDLRTHHLYEISNEVPGIYTLYNGTPIEHCISQLVPNSGSFSPVTRCWHVSDFRFGPTVAPSPSP